MSIKEYADHKREAIRENSRHENYDNLISHKMINMCNQRKNKVIYIFKSALECEQKY